jgi:uncharacterized protein (DUF1499 family)
MKTTTFHSHRIANYLATISIALILSACSGSRPIHLGEPLSALDPCPESPNCVSTEASSDDEEHYITPISITSKQDAHETLVTLIQANPSAELVINSPNYLYAEYTSKWMRFVDDVEFLFDESSNQIQVRSASRLGHKDFGVNRERIEAIRAQIKLGN